MKICFFTESYYTGGLDTFILGLINHWPDEEDQLTLICNNSHAGFNLLAEKINRKNTVIIGHHLLMSPDLNKLLERKIGRNKISKLLGVVLKYFLFISYLFKLKNIIDIEKYDELLVINGGYPAGFSCRAATIFWGTRKKQKSIHNFHNFAVKPKAFLKLIEVPIDFFVQKYTSYFVTVSKVCSESMRNRSVIWNRSVVKYIYNGISPLSQDLNFNVNVRNEFHIPEDNEICLFLATYEERKGHEFLLKSFAKVINARANAVLICCGYGEEADLNRVRDMVSELGLSNNVILTNFRNDVIAMLSQSDILLIASESFESFGLTALEAMRLKIPVVSTNTGGLKEVIKHNCGGYLFDYGDTDGYSSKVLELLNSEKLRAEQGEKGYQRFVDTFTVDKMTTQYCSLLKCE
jgi:glycosyltransferase involved in cell wall biosynthesis